MHTEGPWEALTTRGFVVLRELLSEDERGAVERAYSRSREADVAIYSAREPSPRDVAFVAEKLAPLLSEIRRCTGNEADTVLSESVFFATDRMNLGWHTDYKSYYLFQTHRNQLTFWVPIIKPDSRSSGLAIVPMDRLLEHAPDVHAVLVGRGASRWESGSIHYEEGGADREIPCPIDLEEIAEAPELAPGDALVMRADLLHRTQDVRTRRVSLSMRALSGEGRLSRRALLTASPGKRRRMLGEPNAFCDVLAAFYLYRRPEITVRELLAARSRLARKEPLPLLAFAGSKLLLPHLLRGAST